MKYKGTMICAAAVLALAATTGAQAAGQTLSKEHQTALVKKNASQRNFQRPTTMKDAERTEQRVAGGGTMVTVPNELFNQMYVQKDAEGKLVVHEADANATIDATQQEVLPNE